MKKIHAGYLLLITLADAVCLYLLDYLSDGKIAWNPVKALVSLLVAAITVYFIFILSERKNKNT
jgi:hypothetical protein